MTIRLREVVRSEVEGGLSGPANPIPSESIDCGCGQLPCPRLARFATRRLFVGLLCWIGAVQAAGYVYFYVTGPTIARRFHLDTYLMNWILVTSKITPFALGLIVAYWGDKIHRAAWIGALTLLQSAAYFTLLIPQLTHRIRVIEETENVTHMSLYADDSRELCSAASSRIVIEEDEPCYVTLGILIVSQVIAGAASIAYYSLGISYVDDNTKMRHVAAFIGVILAVEVVGVFLGYVLAWGCLRIDAEDLSVVKSYREQVGAWWLGYPILASLLFIPGLLLSWFPRRLPSEVVEQAAASLLDRANTYNRNIQRTAQPKIGSTYFRPSLARLITNKVLMFNILGSVLCATAVTNFMQNENIILESRFYIPKPNGIFLGFGDPLTSRIVTSILKPVIVGLIIILSGLLIARARPRARFIIGYNCIMIIISAIIIGSLIFATCEKTRIVGMTTRGTVSLLKWCNRLCQCSKDSDFRPVCDSKGMVTFYSACHAGCKTVEYVDGTKIYDRCSCVKDETGSGNFQAKDGPCGSTSCQTGWLAFEFGTMAVYALMGSTFVGDLLINVRSVYRQDKALSIGFWMSLAGIFVYVLGKLLYETIADITCLHWGLDKSVCRLHESTTLGDYMCYLTALLLALGLLFKILACIFCRNLRLYNQLENEIHDGAREMQEIIRIQTADTTPQEQNAATDTNVGNNGSTVGIAAVAETHAPSEATGETSGQTIREEDEHQTTDRPLKYGPLGPGDRRTGNKSRARKSRSRDLETDDEMGSSSDESKIGSSPVVAYTPLDIDSDVESELSSIDPRSRKRVHSRDYDQLPSEENVAASTFKREFPNPANYEDPRSVRLSMRQGGRDLEDGSWPTNSFQYARPVGTGGAAKIGDFNEVGIPVDPILEESYDVGRNNVPGHVPVKSLINQYERKSSLECLDVDEKSSLKSNDDRQNRGDSRPMPGSIPLIAMAARPSSRGHTSSGFSSLADDHDKVPEVTSNKSQSPEASGKRGKKTICTDL